MWAHKIGKLQEPPTQNIPRLNVQCPCIGKIKGADDSTFSYQSLEANMDDLYLIKNFGPKTNPRDFIDTFFSSK